MITRIDRTGRRWIRACVPALVLMVVLVTASCGSDAPVASDHVLPPAADEPRVMYVALGGDETLNRGLDSSVRRTWPQQVFATALPRSAVYVNLAATRAPVQRGVDDQLPAALALRPTLATVWFGYADAQANVADRDFRRDLTTIVTGLQGAGTRVLLITRTAPDAGSGSRYAEVIAAVAGETGAELVPVPTMSRRPIDPGAQSAIAEAVMARLPH